MEWRDLIIDGYGRVRETLGTALDGLTQDDLNWQPHPDCNSMGWLAWHLTRVQDHHIADLVGEAQLWISDGWHAKFNRALDPEDRGFGHSPADVAAFRSPDVETLLGYHGVVLARTQRYLTTLPTADLDRELSESWFQPPPTVGVRLVSVMDDGLKHAGQVAYLRGLLQGRGWQSY